MSSVARLIEATEIMLHPSQLHSVEVGWLHSDRKYILPLIINLLIESKRGGKKVLAVSSEEGTVCFLDAEKRGGVRCKSGPPSAGWVFLRQVA